MIETEKFRGCVATMFKQQEPHSLNTDTTNIKCDVGLRSSSTSCVDIFLTFRLKTQLLYSELKRLIMPQQTKDKIK